MNLTLLSFEVTDLKTRLDKAIVGASDFSRSKIQKDIELGFVEVNGTPVVEAKFVVRKGDKVVYTPSKEAPSAPKDIPIKTLYNGQGLLIIDKPPGLAVHPGAGFKGDSLAEALLFHFKDIKLVGEEGRAGIVHRLDKDTSGVMLIALTQEIYLHLKDAFAERKIKKEYIALVEGKLEPRHAFIDTPIGKSKKDFRKYSTKDMLAEKPSLTEYQVLEYLQSDQPQVKGAVDQYTLVMVKLHTGRTHQIRVHMASLGHPLAGDSLYGRPKSSLPLLSRQFLHARKIEVRLPDETWIEAETEIPADLREVLVNLHSKKVVDL